jgi:hypothetical protein
VIFAAEAFEANFDHGGPLVKEGDEAAGRH